MKVEGTALLPAAWVVRLPSRAETPKIFARSLRRVNDAIKIIDGLIDGLSEMERKVLWSNLADRWGDEIRQEIGA